MAKIIVKHDPKAAVSHRGGFLLLHEYLDHIGFDKRVNKEFGAPGSNRGYAASVFVRTLVQMFVDGILALEDVHMLEEDSLFKSITKDPTLPSSDAIGDWLRRQGGVNNQAANPGEEAMLRIIKDHLACSVMEQPSILDIDTTILECDKADSQWTYKSGVRGYQPLIALLNNPSRVVAVEFRNGNVAPQYGLKPFLEKCLGQLSKEHIFCIRSDSAAYDHNVFNFCFDQKLYFSITADQDRAVKDHIRSIKTWEEGRLKDGSPAPWQYAEVIHCMNKTKQAFRLIIKRTKRRQEDLFEPYIHWCIATNLNEEQYDANAVILLHEGRGNMERLIGELKNHYNLDHVPCSQLKANAVYFAIGLLTFNLMNHLQEITDHKPKIKPSMRSLRRYQFHLPAYLVKHARAMILYITAAHSCYEILTKALNVIDKYHPPNLA